jgi:hypothetical protein
MKDAATFFAKVQDRAFLLSEVSRPMAPMAICNPHRKNALTGQKMYPKWQHPPIY